MSVKKAGRSLKPRPAFFMCMIQLYILIMYYMFDMTSYTYYVLYTSNDFIYFLCIVRMISL